MTVFEGILLLTTITFMVLFIVFVVLWKKLRDNQCPTCSTCPTCPTCPTVPTLPSSNNVQAYYTFTNVADGNILSVCPSGCMLANVKYNQGNSAVAYLIPPPTKLTDNNVWTLIEANDNIYGLYSPSSQSLLSVCGDCVTTTPATSNLVDVHGAMSYIATNWTQFTITPVTGTTNIVTLKNSYTNSYLSTCTGGACATYLTTGTGLAFISDNTQKSAQWIITQLSL